MIYHIIVLSDFTRIFFSKLDLFSFFFSLNFTTKELIIKIHSK
jgi:hypothetical protein